MLHDGYASNVNKFCDAQVQAALLQPVSACLIDAAASHQFDIPLGFVLQLPDRCCVLPADEELAVLHVCVDSILQCASEEVLNSEGAAVPASRAGWSRSGSCCHCSLPTGYACRGGPKRGAHLLLMLPVAACIHSSILTKVCTSLCT